jgi:hypothetical protein
MALNHSPRVVTDGLVLCLDAANPKSYPGSGRDGYNLYYTKVGVTSGFNYIASERFGTGTQVNVGLTLSDSNFFNNWHQFFVTYDGNTLRFYRNGIFVNSGASTSDITNTSQSLTIAVRGGNYSDSNISIVRFYNLALTSNEVQANFNALRGRFGI